MEMNFELTDKLIFKFLNRRKDGTLDPVGNIFKNKDDYIKDIKIKKDYNFYVCHIIDKNNFVIATIISDIIQVYDNLETKHMVAVYE